ncbi:uncharacterized protein LOC143030232 [Oratosquilla oratoria]|uniref:uncharacterized protein LOC143030232 n=1 Tax=Oratosquilla oratoria TaxID=337810 RepID=UPI003F75E046
MDVVPLHKENGKCVDLLDSLCNYIFGLEIKVKWFHFAHLGHQWPKGMLEDWSVEFVILQYCVLSRLQDDCSGIAAVMCWLNYRIERLLSSCWHVASLMEGRAMYE